MIDKSAALITVIFPMTELRGEVTEHLRSWTQRQTLPRERFRVIAAFKGSDRSEADDVGRFLGPTDELLPVPNANTSAILNAAAARASTPWLLFTEGHCLADPGCLEAVARWIAANPAAEVANTNLTHKGGSLTAQLIANWYGVVLAHWRTPNTWPRVLPAGFVIRSDLIRTTGGFVPEHDVFSAHYLSALLNARGARIDLIPDARIAHVDEERMSSHHSSTARYAFGEFNARAVMDAVFMEHYFGHVPLWANRLRSRPRTSLTMLRAVLAAAGTHPKSSLKLVAELRQLAADLIAPLWMRIALNRLRVRMDEIAIEWLPMPAPLRSTRFVRAHARVVQLTKLTWIRHRATALARPLGIGHWPIEGLGPDTIVGVHALEQHGGCRFRWTEPVAMIHLQPSENDSELRFETGGLRGDPLAAVIAVVAAGRVLPRELLSSENGTLIVRLPASSSSTGSRDELVVVCDPLVPARAGVLDQRRLGLPIGSISIAPLHVAARRIAAE